ncbi:hypothetical protein L596_010599 [Steinernema carpocapsae]|uniref:Metallo-beta-lactamase domain-containing protein 1 n=1 Tax=Steinernema carpocapsae TaxID=34508 RepID=A0A4U5PJI7_STECR|nr:hypothetical protein L596_010599 [Steinernema carpocapsae]
MLRIPELNITVEQLIIGYCKSVLSPWIQMPWGCFQASGSVSYVCTEAQDGVDVLVDLGSPYNREEVKNAIWKKLEANLKNGWAEKRLYVVLSHCHIDHIGNLDLVDDLKEFRGFKAVQIICGQDLKDELKITDRIRIIQTPGHTDHDISVIIDVGKDRNIAIVGDLYDCQEDREDKEIWEASSSNPMLQARTREWMEKEAQVGFIIPGHGPGFYISGEAKAVEHIYPEIPPISTCYPISSVPFSSTPKNEPEALRLNAGTDEDQFEVLINCGREVKAMTDEEREKVNMVIVHGHYSNAYGLGLFPHAQIVLGRDLAAPGGVYTGDHIQEAEAEL